MISVTPAQLVIPAVAEANGGRRTPVKILANSALSFRGHSKHPASLSAIALQRKGREGAGGWWRVEGRSQEGRKDG